MPKNRHGVYSTRYSPWLPFAFRSQQLGGFEMTIPAVKGFLLNSMKSSNMFAALLAECNVRPRSFIRIISRSLDDMRHCLFGSDSQFATRTVA
jgi:hypothetical protein